MWERCFPEGLPADAASTFKRGQGLTLAAIGPVFDTALRTQSAGALARLAAQLEELPYFACGTPRTGKQTIVTAGAFVAPWDCYRACDTHIARQPRVTAAILPAAFAVSQRMLDDLEPAQAEVRDLFHRITCPLWEHLNNPASAIRRGVYGAEQAKNAEELLDRVPPAFWRGAALAALRLDGLTPN
jgi:hypothetical protein